MSLFQSGGHVLDLPLQPPHSQVHTVQVPTHDLRPSEFELNTLETKMIIITCVEAVCTVYVPVLKQVGERMLLYGRKRYHQRWGESVWVCCVAKIY